MLLRKDSEKAIFNDVVDKQLSPVLTALGFKYVKSKYRFEKGTKDFIQVILLSRSPLSFDADTDQLYLKLHLRFSIQHHQYDKWHENEFKDKNIFDHMVKGVWLLASVDFDHLSKDDFYEPSKAVAFKRQVSASLARHSPDPETVPLQKGLQEMHAHVNEVDAFCDYRKLFAARPHPLTQSYVNLPIYFNDLNLARETYQANFETLCDGFKNALEANSSDVGRYVDALNRYKTIGEKFLDLHFQVPAQVGFKSVKTGKTLDFGVPGLQFQELFTLEKPFRKILRCAVNPINGRIILAHEGQVATVWSASGDLLLEFILVYPDGYDELRDFQVGYLDAANAFYANNYIVTEDLNVHALEIPLVKTTKDKYKIHSQLSVPVAYCEETGQFIILFNRLKKTHAFFYDSQFKLVRRFETELREMDILPKRKWIATYEYMKKIVLLDFSGNVVAELESSNANLGIGNVNYHDVSKNENYFFSFFYNVKSMLFSLKDFSKKVMWGHTTFEKDYKERYYNDINHNFGVAPARFAPDETYIVGGADHGKYVAWRLPSGDRYELIPNADFLAKLPHALVFKIGDRTYLKNRGNGIRDIQFFGNGDFFTTLINDDVLIWDRAFNHLTTFQDIGKVVPFTDNYLVVQKGDVFRFYKKA